MNNLATAITTFFYAFGVLIVFAAAREAGQPWLVAVVAGIIWPIIAAVVTGNYVWGGGG